MNTNFSGKRALVTGAGDGIGRATALKLAQLGAEVIALSKTQANLNSLKAENPAIKTICVDIGNWEETRAAVKKFTPIHLLVNNAGIAQLAPFVDQTSEEFDLSFSINVKAVMNVSQVVGSDLVARKSRGSIVNVSSQAALRAFEDGTIYCATKAALDAMTRNMALELGPKGIRVNSVNPTVTKTKMASIAWSDQKKKDWMIGRIPQKKFAEVEDVVNAIVYLLCDSSDMVNGIVLPVDGGFLAA